jgi:hypothetical protein
MCLVLKSIFNTSASQSGGKNDFYTRIQYKVLVCLNLAPASFRDPARACSPS